MDTKEFECPSCRQTIIVPVSPARISLELFVCPKCRASVVLVSSRSSQQPLDMCLTIHQEGLNDEIERLLAMLTDVYILVNNYQSEMDCGDFTPDPEEDISFEPEAGLDPPIFADGSSNVVGGSKAERAKFN